MDLDGDGIMDIISGSYWPGHLYLFRGLSDGTFAEGVKLQDSAGNDLIASPPWEGERTPHMDSLASVPFAYDFNGSGVLDLLVGNIAGHVMFIPNIGTPDEMKFCADTRIRIKAGGEEIKVGGGDSGPVMVDWDGDGRDDLLVGAGDGSVWFYRNIGTDEETGTPLFAEGVALLDANPMYRGRSGEDYDPTAEPTRPGTRVKVHAVDFNGNGHLDLLVGDFSMRQKPEPDLTEEQVARRDELRAERNKLNEKMQEFFRRLDEDGTDWDDLTQDEDFMALQTRMMDISTELTPLEAGWEYGGFVWLYLRKVE